MKTKLDQVKTKVSEYQTSKKPYPVRKDTRVPMRSYETDPFNKYQNFLYRRAMYGLTVYSPGEVEKFHQDKKDRIERVHKRCQVVLNLWKQELTNEYTNRLFETLFPRSEFARLFFVKYRNATDPDFINYIPFKDLGIDKVQIVNRLVMKGVLPKNFYSIKDDPTQKETLSQVSTA